MWFALFLVMSDNSVSCHTNRCSCTLEIDPFLYFIAATGKPAKLKILPSHASGHISCVGIWEGGGDLGTARTLSTFWLCFCGNLKLKYNGFTRTLVSVSPYAQSMVTIGFTRRLFVHQKGPQLGFAL